MTEFLIHRNGESVNVSEIQKATSLSVRVVCYRTTSLIRVLTWEVLHAGTQTPAPK